MRTLALSGGDLMVGTGGYVTVTGAAKIRQDLALALGEPYGDDRFHATLGSVLGSFIGQPISPDTESLVSSEVARVVQSYIGSQKAGILQDALRSRRSRYSTADIVVAVLGIQTNLYFDSISVTVDLQTQAGEQLSINRTVSL